MSEKKLQLEIITPEKVAVHKDIDSLIAPGEEGYFGVLPGHTPFLALLGIGKIVYKIGGEEKHLSVNAGFVEVLPDKIIILTNSAEHAEDIDRGRAQEAHDRAMERLRSKSPDIDFERAQAALARAINRLKISKSL
jgi:F-type H+-transporting ATPase subunit epsilon